LSDYVKEACVESLQEAIQAEQNGADRLELCSRLDLDGLTPNKDLIKDVINTVGIPVKVMIRPRKGNFIYSSYELELMKKDILFCKKNNVFGVVFGILESSKTIDIRATNYLASFAEGLDITFHKAIDKVEDIFREVKRLNKVSLIKNILTSGGKGNAKEGSSIIVEIHKNFFHDCNIIAAGSITEKNLDEIHDRLKLNEYHGRKIVGDLTLNG